MATEFYHSSRRNTSLLRTSLLEEPTSPNQSLDLMFVRSASFFSGSHHQALGSFHQSQLSNFFFGMPCFHFYSGLGILSLFLDFNRVSLNLRKFAFSVGCPSVIE